MSLLTVVACAPSAASRPDAPPRPVGAAAGAGAPSEPDGGSQAAERPESAPRASTGGRTPAAAPRSAAALAAGRAGARFDLDGDGRDELVVGAAASPGGTALHVRYSRVARRDTVTAPASAPGYLLAPRYTAGDFNGDDFQDLAVAAFRTPAQGAVEHAILVYSGGPDGLDRDRVTLLPGLNAGAFAAGDLDRDGDDELAVGDGGATEQRDGPFRGSVTVLSGSPNGVTLTGSVRLQQVVPRWSGLVEENFGTHLAIGDFTGDGYADLVVNGSRRGTSETDWHGMLTLFPGSATGPDTRRVSKIEGQLDAVADPIPVDTMLLSDLDRDGRADLVLGLPRSSGGRVIYLRGAAAGLSWAGRRVIDQDTPGVPGRPDPDSTGGHFGAALATGDVTGDGIPDLLVGAMTMTVGAAADAGSVTLLPGTPQGPTGAGAIAYTQAVQTGDWPRPPAEFGQSAATLRDQPEPNDYLGSAVAILDLDGTGPLEMFAVAKYEDRWQQPADAPYGLLTTLGLQTRTPPRGSTGPAASRLVPLRQQRPADLSGGGIRLLHFGYGLLSN
ncbi:FG-GAP and VCBS repeat-containing protein [Micromonospora sp. NPDC049836]|uniref:FG-GAP and VCBS repeat-containing protein n=1 Tax=Micromonospora sp. NPDC049836 TaxID=3364274 RepID=UPI0037A9D08E